MSLPLEKLLVDFSANPAAGEQAIQGAERECGVQFPDDYRAFLAQFNGGEGFIGKHYLVLEKAEELMKFNRDLEVNEYAPGFFMFGSDGGGDGFAFDTRSSPYRVVIVPFIGMSIEDGIVVAESFLGLLEKMKQTDGPIF